MLLQILRDLPDFAWLVQTNPNPETNELLDVSIRPEFQPLAQEARDSANCAFHRYGRKYRYPEPYPCQKVFCKGAADDARDRFLLGGKNPDQSAGTFAFALRGMQLHNQPASCSRRKVCKRRQNIPVDGFRTTIRYVVSFGDTENVGPESLADGTFRSPPTERKGGSANLYPLLRDSAPSHKIIFLHLPFGPDYIGIAALE